MQERALSEQMELAATVALPLMLYEVRRAERKFSARLGEGEGAEERLRGGQARLITSVRTARSGIS
jgi:hypothetical protein